MKGKQQGEQENLGWQGSPRLGDGAVNTCLRGEGLGG